jgi:PAS domain S-box-containing protein/putative nucleotidyltransferase with HDIG domain
MRKKIRVLLIEDCESDAALNVRRLENSGFAVESERVDDAGQMKQALQKAAWDIILADHNLPQFDSLSALAVLRESGQDIPFIVVSGTIGEEIAVEVMKAGAHDYVLKNNLVRLGPAVERELRESRIRLERRGSEHALRESEERYRDLVENVHDLICTHDLDGNLLTVNAAAARLTGYPLSTLLKMNLGNLLTSAARPRLADYLTQVRSKGRASGIMEVRTAAGEVRYWEYDNSLRTQGVAAPIVRALARDITSRMRAERNLLESEEKYRRIVELAEEGILSIDEGQRISFANRAMAEILGYAQDELVGRPVGDFIFEEDQTELEHRIEERRRGEIGRYERKFRRKDGTTVWTLVSATPILDADGRFQGSFGMFTDITERKRAEEDLRRSNEHLRRAVDGAVRAIAMASEVRDPYTAGHQQRVAELASAIALELGLPPERIEAIHAAGILHDVGKIHIPAEILSKPTPLNVHEMNIIRIHPQVGYDILKTLELPWDIASGVLQHHERLDGSGYPAGLAGEEIVVEARILAVADVVEAMASHRPYRASLGIEPALEEIALNRGKLYDPPTSDACLRLFREKGFRWTA